MPDDKTKTGGADRSRVASEQTYEVRHFAQKHGISNEDAEQIIRKAGPSREDADRMAAQLRKR